MERWLGKYSELAYALMRIVVGLVAIGLFAGYAAFITSGQMAVAYFMVHAPKGFWPILHGGNEGEPAVLYCFVFLYIAFKGSGPLSVDALLKRRRS